MANTEQAKLASSSTVAATSTSSTPVNGKETLEQEIARLRMELSAAKAANNAPIKFKVSEKGAVSAYGLGRFPVTLYKSQWLRVIESIPSLSQFIKDNESVLTIKDAK